jgi:hypothetical protein
MLIMNERDLQRRMQRRTLAAPQATPADLQEVWMSKAGSPNNHQDQEEDIITEEGDFNLCKAWVLQSELTSGWQPNWTYLLEEDAGNFSSLMASNRVDGEEVFVYPCNSLTDHFQCNKIRQRLQDFLKEAMT